MSIWQLAPQDDVDSGEPFVRNTVAWDQLLNNLDLQTSSDSSSSSDEDGEVILKSLTSNLSEGKHSHQSKRLRMTPSSPNSRECAKQRAFPVGAREDDGYSSEDEHDSPANQASSESTAAGFCPSSGLTATTKAGSTISKVSEPASPDDTPKAFFFVNGVRHCVQDEQRGSKWGAMAVQKAPITPKSAAAESLTWTTALPLPERGEAAARTVIASNDAGAPAAWVYTPKAAAHVQASHRSPPRYEAPQSVPEGFVVPPTPDFRAMHSHSTVPGNARPFTTGQMRAGNAAAVPQPHAFGNMPTQAASGAPFYTGKPVPVSGAATAVNSILGYVYVDGEGRLCVASRDGSPQPSAVQAPMSAYPPPMALATQQTQLSQQMGNSSAAAAAALQGASPMPGMSPMLYGMSYAADGSMSQPAAPSMPVSKPSRSAWGTTKAWAYRDGRWISLSM